MRRVCWLAGVWADSNVRYEYRRELIERSLDTSDTVMRFATGVFGQHMCSSLKRDVCVHGKDWSRPASLDEWTQGVFRGKRCAVNMTLTRWRFLTNESHMRRRSVMWEHRERA